MWKENYKFVIAGKRCPINQELDMTKTKVKHRVIMQNKEYSYRSKRKEKVPNGSGTQY